MKRFSQFQKIALLLTLTCAEAICMILPWRVYPWESVVWGWIYIWITILPLSLSFVFSYSAIFREHLLIRIAGEISHLAFFGSLCFAIWAEDESLGFLEGILPPFWIALLIAAAIFVNFNIGWIHHAVKKRTLPTDSPPTPTTI